MCRLPVWLNSQKVFSGRIARNHNYIPLFNVKYENLRNSFFHQLLLSRLTLIIVFKIWNQLVLLNNKVLKSIRPSPNGTFTEHNFQGIKLLTRLQVGLSHFHVHKTHHSRLPEPIGNCAWHIQTNSPLLKLLKLK